MQPWPSCLDPANCNTEDPDYATEEVHISQIRVGDVVHHDDAFRTVGRKQIRKDSFMGYCLFGDAYRLGTKKVTRATVNKRKN